MIEKNNKNTYVSRVAVPPGETLQELLDEKNITQIELAKRMGHTPKFVNELISGKASITADTAIKLENVLGVAASFWNNLEANYQETKARLRAEKDLQKETKDAAEYPYGEMAKCGWVPECSDELGRTKNLLSFFGVTSFQNIIENQKLSEFCFRKSEKKKYSLPAIIAWLRRGVIEAQEIESKPYDGNKLQKAVQAIRPLTQKDPNVLNNEVKTILANCGVSFVILPKLKNAPINGATRWLSPSRALIQLSIRNRFNDIIWFTLFHEIGHVLYEHKKKLINVDFEINEDDRDEREANTFAENALIPKDEYKNFVNKGAFTYLALQKFAQSINIHPGIVLGRLQHDGLLSYSVLGDLKSRLYFESELKTN